MFAQDTMRHCVSQYLHLCSVYMFFFKIQLKSELQKMLLSLDKILHQLTLW